MKHHTNGLALGLLVLGIARFAVAQDPWVIYPGGEGPGKGKHIVFITGEESYRSEESMPLMARILSRYHGFKCTVLFAVNPNDGTIDPMVKDNIPGLEALDSADLMVAFLRWRELPDDQMKRLIDYTESGKPIIGIRNATHPFRYIKRPDNPYARYDSASKDPQGGWGRAVLGETWVSHYGKNLVESTRCGRKISQNFTGWFTTIQTRHFRFKVTLRRYPTPETIRVATNTEEIGPPCATAWPMTPGWQGTSLLYLCGQCSLPCAVGCAIVALPGMRTAGP